MFSDGGWVGPPMGDSHDDGGCSLVEFRWVEGWRGREPSGGVGGWAGKAVHRILTPQGLDFVNSNAISPYGSALHSVHCSTLPWSFFT